MAPIVDLFACDSECGCAAKIPADRLRTLLQGLHIPTNPSVIVGPDTLDDAGVYRISDDLCLVQTVDFFPPVARDPRMYGQIAAANSLSDVYAMGGTPLTALAVVCFPAKKFEPGVLADITRGAVEKLTEAGAVLLGGHSIVDAQPKYGLSVTGLVRMNRILDNAHARPGDILILTKPLGTGTTITAAKAGIATPEHETKANQCMAALNAAASRIALDCGVVSCTDITGFGFLGHALQVARASRVSLEVWMDRIPRLDGAIEFAAMGLLSAACHANRKYVGAAARFAEDIRLAEQDILFDPQTSGGLLLCCPPDTADALAARARAELTTPSSIVGRVLDEADEPDIRVMRDRRKG